MFERFLFFILIKFYLIKEYLLCRVFKTNFDDREFKFKYYYLSIEIFHNQIK